MIKKKKALITGITGQDGSYLAEFLISKGYEVYGLIRRSSSMTNRKHIDKIKDLILVYGDMTDGCSIEGVINSIMPDEIYNLAAQSHVGISFRIPEYTINTNALGLVRILEAVKKIALKIKVYQASTSEMFGNQGKNVKANEKYPFTVNSPYASSKLMAHNICVMYREAYNMFICCGILFNHESPRRGENFVTQKIVKGLCAILKNKTDYLRLGNLDAVRDWGHAADYVEAMWLMMQQDKPDDYVIATGVAHTVRDFIEEACNCLDITTEWESEGVCFLWQKSILVGTIIVDKKYYRPLEVPYLLGDASKALKVLNWKPNVSFKMLVELMVRNEWRR